jgi:hypothetical protein
MIARQVRAPPLVLVLVLIVALTAMGVSYGLWAKTLTIEGTVNTGEVDARWEFSGCYEFYPWPEGGNYGEAEGKDIGKWDLWVDPADDQVLHFEIENGYPSYAVDCKLNYVIEGTIPVYIRGATIIPGINLTGCSLTSTAQSRLLECDQLTVYFVDGIGLQYHPDEPVASNLKVHVEQPAEQDTNYYFELAICMAQWNEDATEEECLIAAQSP